MVLALVLFRLFYLYGDALIALYGSSVGQPLLRHRTEHSPAVLMMTGGAWMLTKQGPSLHYLILALGSYVLGNYHQL